MFVVTWFVSTSLSFCFPMRRALLGKQEQCKTHQGRAVNLQLTGCYESGVQFVFIVLFMLRQRELSHEWQCLFLATILVSWPVLSPPAMRWFVMDCDWGIIPLANPVYRFLILALLSVGKRRPRRAEEGGWEDMGNKMSWYTSSALFHSCSGMCSLLPTDAGRCSLRWWHFSRRGRKE